MKYPLRTKIIIVNHGAEGGPCFTKTKKRYTGFEDWRSELIRWLRIRIWDEMRGLARLEGDGPTLSLKVDSTQAEAFIAVHKQVCLCTFVGPKIVHRVGDFEIIVETQERE